MIIVKNYVINYVIRGVVVAGGTFAWWSWASSDQQKTGVSFIVQNGSEQLSAILDANTTTINDLAPATNCVGSNAKKVNIVISYENLSSVNATN